MKKKTKIIVGTISAVLVIAVLVAVGCYAYLIHAWNGNHRFADYLINEGPWSSEDTWVSDDGNSYLVARMVPEKSSRIANVTACFKSGEDWQSYEVHLTGHLAAFHKVENGIVVQSSQGRMKFDGTTFTVYELDETLFGSSEYRYTIKNSDQ